MRTLLVTLLLATAAAAQPQVPSSLPFQGRLTLQAGGNATGVLQMTFRMYGAATGGNPLWTEVQTAVSVQNGLFKTELGSTTAFPAGLFDGSTLYLGVQVGNDTEMVPRLTLSSQAYAMLAENAMDVLGQNINPNTVTVNGTQVIDSTGSWVGSPTGLQGPAGPAGANGPAGPAGPAGPQGATGSVGPIGPQGTQGNTGPAGPAGAQGLQGDPGPIGPAGPQGLQGNAGPAGPQGLQGLVGPVGPQGTRGLTGPTGRTGAQGSQGIPGPVGATGPQGPQGPTGISPFGLNGTSAYYDQGNVGVGTQSPSFPLEVQAGSATYGLAVFSSTATGAAVRGETNAQNGHGLEGVSTSATSTSSNSGAGVYGSAAARFSPGVEGVNSADFGVGVRGVATGQFGYGVYGDAAATNGQFGVYGITRADSYGPVYGTYGRAIANGTASNDRARGLYGIAYSMRARAVYGHADGDRTTLSKELCGVYGLMSGTGGFGVYSDGELGASGTKSFLQPHPTDPALAVRFVCLEGNEAGTYFRGSARLVGGVAEISIPEDWRLVSEADGITVQVTPVGSPSMLYVAEKSRERIVIRGQPDADFDYTVNGLRRGYASFPTIIPNEFFKPEIRGEPFGRQYSAEMRQILVQNGILNPDFTPNEATAARLGWELVEASEAESALGPDELQQRAAGATTARSR